MAQMISYAQNHEDVILRRALPQAEGFYIDVGAAHPTSHSVTRWFYDQGWSGINVEPLPQFYERLAADRPRDINLQLCLSSNAGESTFYEVPSCIGWATMEAEAADVIRSTGKELVPRPCPTATLAQICEKYAADRRIDFLKIDVEGHEKAVLEGADFTRFRPRILVVEATEVGRPILNHDKWESMVLRSGYFFALFDGLNRYYVRCEESDLAASLTVPANVFDDFITFEHWEANRELGVLRERLAELESQLTTR